MTRLGIFGGSFDPIHMAHLVLAEAVREERGLETVLFVPARQAVHKSVQPLAAPRRRLEMLRLALEGNGAFEVSTVELDRETPSYTLLTTRELQRSVGAGARLSLIIGADSLLDMPNWWRAKELVEEIDLIVVRRPGYPLDNVTGLRRAFGSQTTERMRRAAVDAPLMDISSSEVRKRIGEGKSVRYLVPEAVRHYIEAHGLYGAPCRGQ